MMPQIIAHRGASNAAPENTLAAFRQAWEDGADAIEMDLRLSRDGKVVVVHDDDLKRVAGDLRKVEALSATELAKVITRQAGKGSLGVEAKVPLLKEVLDEVPGSKRVFLECKVGREMLPMLRSEIEGSGLGSGQIAVIGFDLGLVQAAKVMMPEVEVSWVVDYPGMTTFGQILGKAIKAEIDGLDLSARWPLREDRVAQAHAAGLQVYVWTVDEPLRASQLAKTGVDGLTTNVPLRLRQALESKG